MINYIVYIIIFVILVLVSFIAIKAVNRGIEAKQRLNQDLNNNNFETKKKKIKKIKYFTYSNL